MDGDYSLQAHKRNPAEMVKDLLGRGTVLGLVLQALSNQLLHVRPLWAAKLLNIRNGVSLHRGWGGETIMQRYTSLAC